MGGRGGQAGQRGKGLLQSIWLLACHPLSTSRKIAVPAPLPPTPPDTTLILPHSLLRLPLPPFPASSHIPHTPSSQPFHLPPPCQNVPSADPPPPHLHCIAYDLLHKSAAPARPHLFLPPSSPPFPTPPCHLPTCFDSRLMRCTQLLPSLPSPFPPPFLSPYPLTLPFPPLPHLQCNPSDTLHRTAATPSPSAPSPTFNIELSILPPFIPTCTKSCLMRCTK